MSTEDSPPPWEATTYNALPTMDVYPTEYIEHNLPLVILSGLGTRPNETSHEGPAASESGTRIQAASPECNGERAQAVLSEFLKLDGSYQPWNAASLPGSSGAMKYKMKTTGRIYTLPPRKAAPLPQSPSTEGLPPISSSSSRTELHSPLSPLSPGSPIFPDGLFTPLWFTKHQASVPALFLAFFHLGATDPDSDSQLKSDINATRLALQRSGFKTRFATILLGEHGIIHASELEERLASIRRLTSLDPKSGLLFLPPITSTAEIATFVQGVMTTQQPLVVEYYRELTKHARRKKAKGGPSIAPSLTSPSGGSASLPQTSWNARYEIKLATFAEFRQEMDVAERHYSTAIDDLFNAEGVLEATPSWSPRWQAARLLADCVAVRDLRCLLWNGKTTEAVRRWGNYRARMKDLVDRRGMGSQSYGWEAWEGRWSDIMATLVKRVELPALQLPYSQRDVVEASQLYVASDRLAVEKVQPWHTLHHPGYWHRLALRGSRARRNKARAIPEEDRVPPGQSPASAVANRSRNYDHYLVPPPHEEYTRDHIGEITKLANAAIEQFQDRGQMRMSEVTKLELAYDLVDVERYEDAMKILVPLWKNSSWRDEDWHDIFAELLLLLRRCAQQVGNVEMVLATVYELLSIKAPLPKGTSLDLSRCLEYARSENKVELAANDRQRLCPVAILYAFQSKETHVGEAVGGQLTITSCANERAVEMTLSSVTVKLGAVKTMRIVNDTSEIQDELIDLSYVAEGPNGVLEAKANLTLFPGQRRMFNLRLTFRDANLFRVNEASISTATKRFNIEHTFTNEEELRSDSIFTKNAENDTLERRFLPHLETNQVTVLPKPPKVQVLVHGLRKQYYTDEVVSLTVEVMNEEADGVEGEIKAGDGREEDETLALRWEDEDEAVASSTQTQPLTYSSVSRAIRHLEPASSHKVALLIQAPSEPTKTTVAIEVDYMLSTDKTTPLRKTLTIDLHFTEPFEVKFHFGPLLYRDPWPSYFDPNIRSTQEEAGAIPQLWSLSSQVRSLATEKLVLRDVRPVVDEVIGDSVARVVSKENPENETFEPGREDKFEFQLLTQKYSLDDRRPTTVVSTLAITWSQSEESQPVTTRLPVPRLTLPVSEPRVLCTLANDLAEGEWDVTLHYWIENPSTHFLTFAITMEATEQFAFSGPKYRTLSLAPLSRHKIEYRLALQDRDEGDQVLDVEGPSGEAGGKWIWPDLQVVDSYYQKTLRVHPGSEKVKFDDQQNIGVWVEGV